MIMAEMAGSATRESRLDRAAGCLAGHFCGDAFGAQFEFKARYSIIQAVGPGYRIMGDSYAWPIARGQITDDSEMAVALADSIIETGRYDSGAALKHYRKWFDSKPFDIGMTTFRALGGYSTPSVTSQTNGALMRISPLAVYHAGQIKEGEEPDLTALLADAALDAGITHPNSTCTASNIVFVQALALAILGHEKDEIYGSICATAETLGDDVLTGSLLEAKDGREPEDMPGKSGWVILSLKNAVYRLMHCETPEQAICETAYMGGDTDTNCAVAGALAGAYFGYDMIPKDWVRTVQECDTSKGNFPRTYQDSIREIRELAVKLYTLGDVGQH
jgi:ADP-ribosyl-[dinitrogen reductase] hydrolase